MAVKLRAEYTPVLHMPVLKEGKSKVAPNALDLYDSSGYTSAGECEYPYITNTQRDLTVFEAIVRCVWICKGTTTGTGSSEIRETIELFVFCSFVPITCV